MNLIQRIIKNKSLYSRVPSFVKRIGRKFLPAYKYDQSIWASQNEFIGTTYEWSCEFGSEQKVGILWDFAQNHVNYIRACHEEKISYQVIDISRHNWQELIKNYGIKYYLAWPSVYQSVWKNMFDNRIRILSDELKMTVFPTEKEVWLYESKIRITEWLKANDLPMLDTEIFYHKEEAIQYLTNKNFPIVIKIDNGASASGVFICQKLADAKKLIRDAFNEGIISKRGDTRDRQWGYVIIQKYLEKAEEWRYVKIGEDYFCRLKGKVGDFHSGSGIVLWAEPDRMVLEMVKNISEKFKFDSLNLDFFKDEDGNFYINEFHTVFGPILKKNISPTDPLMGKYNFKDGEWVFTHGYFYDNACANLRLKYFLDIMR